MYLVITEAENISLDTANDFDGKWYVLLLPSYPWNHLSTEEQSLTRDKTEAIFKKYIKVLTDDVCVDYYSVENGG